MYLKYLLFEEIPKMFLLRGSVRDLHSAAFRQKNIKSGVSGLQTYKCCCCSIYIDPKLWPNKVIEQKTLEKDKKKKELFGITR